MYGTIANMRIKAGHGDALRELIAEWNTERRPKVPGAVEGYLFQHDRDPQDWMMVGIFQDKETFIANANDPEQDRWFRRIVEHLEGEPQWNDGEVHQV